MNPIATKPMLQGEGHRSYGGFPSHLGKAPASWGGSLSLWERGPHCDAWGGQRREKGRRLAPGAPRRAPEPRAKGAPLLEGVPRPRDEILEGAPRRWKVAGAAPELQP